MLQDTSNMEFVHGNFCIGELEGSPSVATCDGLSEKRLYYPTNLCYYGHGNFSIGSMDKDNIWNNNLY